MFPVIPPPVPVIVAYCPQSFHQFNNKGDIRVLESHEIWTSFKEISSIYRESGHNEEISDYLKNKLQNAGFEVEQKKDGTICASRGLNKEGNNAIILQAHMDVVGISADNNPKKPIELHTNDGWLYANDRTLGADNGLGVAAMLAIANDCRFKNSPLEMLITTDEETGMDGARNLSEKDFHGKYLINLDTEEFGVVIKGCAGINQFDLNEKIKMQILQEADYKKITIEFSGARGGHSATINSDSFIPLEAILIELCHVSFFKLVSVSSGERYNAIPRDAKVVILVPKNSERETLDSLECDLGRLREQYRSKNPNLELVITSEDASVGTQYIDSDFQAKMLEALDAIPTGLLSKFEDNGSTKTSQNLGVIKVTDGNFHAQIMGRSADKQEGQKLKEKTAEILSKLFDKTISTADSTPIWQPQSESLLQDVAVEAFSTNNSAKKPIVKVEHGGLESAIFIQKKPDLEQLSIGPTIEEPHSIQERVKIDTVIPFYDWLSRIIERLNPN